MRRLLTKASVLALAAPLIATGFLAATPMAAQAACGGGGSVMCGGDGGGTDDNQKPPTGGSGTNTGNGGSSSGGGGGNAHVDPNRFTIRSTVMAAEQCAVRNDGAKAKAIDFYYTKKFEYGGDPKGSNPYPNSIDAWHFHATVPPNKWLYWSDEYIGMKCLYPSRTKETTLKCSITYSVSVDKVLPNAKTMGKASRKTGYKENSKNYTACKNSSGSVSISLPVTEYGYYSVKTWQRAQNVTVETAITADEVTGKKAAPKIIAVSPAFNTAPKQGMTGSLDCKVGWRTPGVKATKYWTDENCEGDINSSYVCKAPAVRVDGKAIKENDFIQLLRDGKPKSVVWNQTIKGKNVKVQSYTTKFNRSGSPWSKTTNPGKYWFDLSKTSNGPVLNLGSSGAGTSKMSGRVNTLWARGYTASNPGGKTRLTQVVEWKGTKKVQSVRITSINPNTGKISTTPYTATVPTSGSCSQSTNLQYIRTIGTM